MPATLPCERVRNRASRLASVEARGVRSVPGALQRDEVTQRRGERRGVEGGQLVLHQQGAGGVGAEFEHALVVVRTVGVERPAVAAEAPEALGGAATDQRPDAATTGADGGVE